MRKLRSIFGRLLQGYAQRLFRYMGVTVVNTVVGQSVLFIFHAVIGLPGMIANACAVAVSTIPEEQWEAISGEINTSE